MNRLVSVTSAGLIVYCEGEPDNTLLNSLLKPEPPDAPKIQIETIGGKQGWGKFFDAYVSHRGITYKALRDRDLDRKPALDEQGQPKLHEVKPHLYMTGLSCAESYFLDPELLLEYLREYYPTPAQMQTRDALNASLMQVIELVAVYYAVRWAFQEMRNNAGNCAGLEDITANSLDEASCLRNARTQLEQFRADWRSAAAQTDHSATSSNFDEHYQDFKAMFSAPQFRDQRQFTFWFDGKDVLKRWFGKIGGKIGNADLYCTRMASKLSLIKYPDLAEFRNICWKQ